MSDPTSEIPLPIDPDLGAGNRVGEYEVEDKVGQGAFGTVYRAVHPVIGKVVAIKVLARRFSVDPEMGSRFIAEARAVNQIRHRHIIDIFSFDKLEDGRLYYVMEYLDGEPLDALLERGRIPVASTLEILRGIAKALDAAHVKGIAHRDLKAENVFLASDSDGSAAGYFPKLLDFGIAKLMAPDDGLKHKTRTGAPIGTPYYMSPEQCRGRDVDHRTDIYAFGVLAYLMLTGVYPFDADDYMSILMKQISDKPPPPSAHNPELTPEIDTAVLSLMNKDPAERPADLRTATRALEQAAANAGLAMATHWELQTGPVPVQSGSTTMPPNLAIAGRTKLSGAPLTEMTLPRPSRAPLYAGLAAVLALAAGVAVYFGTRPGETEHASMPPPVERPTTPPPEQQRKPEVPAVTPTPDPPVSPTVIVTIDGVPEGTEVFAGGMTVGAAPGPVQLPRDTAAMVLTFKADGYFTQSKEVTPDRDQPLTVTLKKRSSGGSIKKPTRDDLLDPFGNKKGKR